MYMYSIHKICKYIRMYILHLNTHKVACKLFSQRKTETVVTQCLLTSKLLASKQMSKRSP